MYNNKKINAYEYNFGKNLIWAGLQNPDEIKKHQNEICKICNKTCNLHNNSICLNSIPK